MNRTLVLALSALCLTACGQHSVRDDSPASDLDALVSSVGRDLQPRLLPNGKEYCVELARTEREQDDCAGDLEDGLYASNRDKERGMSTLRDGVRRIKLSRNPCRWWQLTCLWEARQKGD
jgi:hypothetical protein